MQHCRGVCLPDSGDEKAAEHKKSLWQAEVVLDSTLSGLSRKSGGREVAGEEKPGIN